MIEFHGRLAAGTAAALIRRLEPFEPAWCEEPVAPECLDLLAEVKRSAPCPIAAGERLYTLADFYRLTALRAADVVQMDLAHCGGISAGKKIAAMAEAQDIAGRAPLLDRAGGPGRLPAFRREHAQLHDPGSVRRIRRALAKRPGRRLEPDQERRVRAGRRPGPGPRARRRGDRRASLRRPRVPQPVGRRLADAISPRTSETEGLIAIPVFRLALTGDFLNEAGSVAYGDAGLGLLVEPARRSLALHQRPGPAARMTRITGQRLYSLEVEPEHIQDVDGLVVLRPWVKKSTFAAGAGDLFVIGRSGAGYDKIDLAACTENGVAVFNAPLALNHSTASSALLFMLALAKRLSEQERIDAAGPLGPAGRGAGQRDPRPHARHRRPGPQRPRAGAAGRSVRDAGHRLFAARRARAGPIAGRRADLARGGAAPVRFREPALPADRGDPRDDRRRRARA